MDHSTPQQVRRMCRPGTASDNIVLHADLETLVLPKTYDEQAAFRRRLDAEGELGSLVVWQGRDMLVEGYDAIHAYREQGSAFTVLEQEFKDLEEVKFWILTRQLNRALSGLALCYLRGKRYLLMEKRQGQRTDLTSSKEWSKSTADGCWGRSKRGREHHLQGRERRRSDRRHRRRLGPCRAGRQGPKRGT